ncbi:MAG: CPBP family intramembrane metalloprotease [Candidatus Omnitrophica bacterium]|nr:CPBP family intramembrane metalloprotease [Candidatus Omnitrophota bacterium]
MRKILIAILCLVSICLVTEYAHRMSVFAKDDNFDLATVHKQFYRKLNVGNKTNQSISFEMFENSLHALYISDKLSEAKFELERLFDKKLDDLSVFKLGIEILKQRNQNPEIVNLCNSFFTQNPQSVEAHLILSKLYIEQADMQLAEKQIARIFELDPDNYSANIDMGKIAYLTNKPLQAIHYFSKAQMLKPEELVSYIEMGKIYFEQNEYAAAIEQLETGKKIKDADLKRNEFALLIDHMKKSANIKYEDFKKSQFVFLLKEAVYGKKVEVEDLKRSEQIILIEQIKKNQKLKHQGFKYIESDSWRELSVYEKKIFQEDLDLLTWLGLAYQKTNQKSKAIQTLESALAINSDNDELRVELARIYLTEEKYEKASRVLELVSESKNFAYEKNVMLAFCYGALSQLSKMRLVMFAHPRVFAIMLGILALLFAASLALIGALFLTAFLIGQKTRHKANKFKNIQWSLSQAFIVCIVLFTLPLCLEIFLGGMVYHNWTLFLSPIKEIQASAGQNALLSQLITVVLTSLIVFWFASKRSGQSLRDLGFRWVKIKKFSLLIIQSLLIIFLFNVLYVGLFSMILGNQPEQQYIVELISKAGKTGNFVILFFLAVIVGPFAEEIIFRGFIFSGLRKHCRFMTAGIISACIFGIFHFQASLFIPLAFMGFVFARLFERTRSILPPLILHMLWNFIIFMNLIFLS